ncbi:MAG: hypothetical protein P4N59_03565 [Negativicutes bacterium]|nr:hypothetical protein [Negativicutes bacterium]
MDKYSKLTEDLRTVQQVVDLLTADSEDGGTCNLDAVFIRLPRYNEEKTNEAIHAAGLSGFKCRHSWFGTGFIVNPNTSGQGNRRARAATVMYNELKSKGYELSHWQQMD